VEHVVNGCEEKYILGIRHVLVKCQLCKGMCWTQPMSALAKQIYQCRTCTEPRETSVGKGLAAVDDMAFD
jgi:hypothetical protein